MNHVQGLLANTTSQGFAFFYCDRNEKDRCEPLSVLKSCVRQLSTVAGSSGVIRKKLQELYHTKRMNGSELTYETCKEQLLEAVNLYKKTTLILDGLDECEPQSRNKIVETINYLLSNSRRPFRVFISSRPDRDITKAFQDQPNIEILAEHIKDDIERFISNEIMRHANWEDMSSSLQEEIVRALSKGSDGM